MVEISPLIRDLVILLVTLVLLINTAIGAKTGSATLIYLSYKRSEDPGLYWFAMLLSGVFGIVGLVGFVFLVLFFPG